AWCGPLYRRIVEEGCAVSELQVSEGLRPRTWWDPANGRTLALLAQMTIVVEAGEHPRELACARVAQARGRDVAAVPGRVSSPASKGTNALLMDGAKLLRDAQDALDVLYGVGTRATAVQERAQVTLEPRLAEVLEGVGRGADTLTKLAARGSQPSELALALIELELRGLLVRGHARKRLGPRSGSPRAVRDRLRRGGGGACPGRARPSLPLEPGQLAVGHVC